jgi:hypothetical protein
MINLNSHFFFFSMNQQILLQTNCQITQQSQKSREKLKHFKKPTEPKPSKERSKY